MPAEQYVTLSAPLRHEVVIDCSRFIACLAPVHDEQGAREAIGALRREFHDARHLPSAFVLGPDRGEQRTSDDGEPAGTAGVPILHALTHHLSPTGGADLADVLAVVVRYFGGIKLGAGGLVRAYGGTVAEALGLAATVQRVRLDVLAVHLPMDAAGRLEAVVRGGGLDVLASHWQGPECIVEVGVEPAARDDARARIAALTSGVARVTQAAGRWVDRTL